MGGRKLELNLCWWIRIGDSYIHIPFIYHLSTIYLSIIWLSVLSMFEFIPTPLTPIQHPRSFILSLYYAAFFSQCSFTYLWLLALPLILDAHVAFSMAPSFPWSLAKLPLPNREKKRWIRTKERDGWRIRGAYISTIYL